MDLRGYLQQIDDLPPPLPALGAGEGIEAPLLIHHLTSDKHFRQFLTYKQTVNGPV